MYIELKPQGLELYKISMGHKVRTKMSLKLLIYLTKTWDHDAEHNLEIDD